jgi:hypothetical protein
MTLLGQTLAAMSKNGLRFALIGATAMAAHGVSRSTMDVDLLLVGHESLDSPAWNEIRQSGASVEVRRGSGDDPLAGVVRIARKGEPSVNIIVGSAPWQRRAIDRATPAELDGTSLPVASARDLIQLKHFAGSPQDRWDVDRLLSVSGNADLANDVESEIHVLPAESRDLWRLIRTAGHE